MSDRTTGTLRRKMRSGRSVKDTADVAGAKSREKREPNLAGADLNTWRKEHLWPNRQGISYSIGARNPYALAERIHLLTPKGRKHPVEWLDNHENPLAWKTNRKRLMAIFHSIPTLEDITYEKLFDPSHYKFSPLFSPVFSIHLAKVPAEKILRETARPDVKRERAVREKAGKKSGKSVLLSATPNPTLTVQPGKLYTPVKAAAQPCSDEGTHWDTYMIPGTTNKCYYYKKINATPADVIDDVVQGCTKDCYFMAALASNVWTKFGNFPPDRASPLKDTYTITFHYSDGTTRDISVESSLTLDAANNPVFARPSTLNEVWHAIYEKAYGVFSLLRQSTLPYTGNYPNYPRPHIPDFPFGDPLNSLEHLTGCSFANSFYDTSTNKDNCYNLMQPAMTTNGTSQTTQYPMVAVSYYDKNEANTANNVTWITYDNEIIVANHSYSILGTVTDSSNNRYIVLRNPYGRLWGGDPTNPAISPYLYTDKWSPTANFYRYLSADDGVFALRDSRFEFYFKRFGWVQ